MNARKQITGAQKKMLKDTIARECKEEFEKTARIAAYRMMLTVLYVLRFDFGFKKRLDRFFDAAVSRNGTLEGLLNDDVAAEVYLKRLTESGCDFGGAFDELLAYDEQRYREKRDKEAAKRNRRANDGNM